MERIFASASAACFEVVVVDGFAGGPVIPWGGYQRRKFWKVRMVLSR